MLEKFIIFGTIIGFMAIEFIRCSIKIWNAIKAKEYASEYRNKLVNYSNNGDEEDYHWLRGDLSRVFSAQKTEQGYDYAA